MASSGQVLWDDEPPTVLGRLVSVLCEGYMKKCAVLGALIAVGTLSITVAAFQQQQPPPPQPSVDAIEVDKIKDNLYVLKGGGGKNSPSPADPGESRKPSGQSKNDPAP